MAMGLEPMIAYLNSIFTAEDMNRIAEQMKVSLEAQSSTLTEHIIKEEEWEALEEVLEMLGQEIENLNEDKSTMALEELEKDIDLQIVSILALKSTTEKCVKAIDVLEKMRGKAFVDKIERFVEKLCRETNKKRSREEDKETRDVKEDLFVRIRETLRAMERD